jgi:endonuclease/exonuclease/phosphatase family metal-dependent hydrolase
VLTRSDWLSRAAKVVGQINSTGSSIVATQENTNSPMNGSTSQYVDLANRLAPSGWALADERNWDYAAGGRGSTSTQATRIYYKSAQWTRVDRGALMTHTPIGSTTSGVNVDRWMSWVKLASTSDPNLQLCVVDAHLLSNLTTNYTPWAVHRNSEIAQLVSELQNPSSTVRRVGTRVGAACAGTPTVVAGDFNAAMSHAPWGNMPVGTLLGSGFVDTKNAAVRYNTRWTGPGTVEGWHETFGTQIDYILASGVGGARSFRVNAAPPSATGSDHYPVTAVISVPSS